MFLGLRKMNGISKKEFSEYFGKSLEDIYGEPICKLESLKLLSKMMTEYGLQNGGSMSATVCL